ncbi:hypothetical protein A2962_00175 [Candidatus Woesebacteria bacterium RIFCSPLOWO2_01_FULL_39_61]|uniref:Glycosyl transferase family 1 n=1 Tax=Candidatus Woesebacteria bacterium RIFCSPHIGHO2_02_FULL_39_13 TaxID=1802505 RepID=A0A1F7Z4N8_9BACT|nr:MAG: hypothetical protein A2692_02590 [Candidatus Woesebacteria bacterium RIFCSPHIGHO2_01_FULL_39_95]OGM33705.1 MAG: hypothetical protein A3D01_06155 [Candidatus Woesebacteria bacterium RIFCSPHIGHO2_02_FULL_39_13]OGM38941.1 MAG: hypothetical protein A3E13_02305 [Candidatus Woesebacteria bacterium RIFCSPHIGHO2_12_FULL_40_20]OGM68153.1 MAG: hypothetical protein A2962_00175 [Candidatus Woesebacteria bacterium RIFCSPLOWO2_01_FULL_39_61]OGM73183.1 MAG: hypothetical protein A3H19_03305 [Candidatus
MASSEGKETGGLNVYVLETAKQLGKLGYKVDMFTRSQDRLKPYLIEVTPNVRLMHLVAGPEKPIPKKNLLPYVDSFTKAFLNFSRKENRTYELLHCHYYLSGLAGLKIKQAYQIPLLMTFHTLALMKNLVGRSEDETEESARLKAERKLVKKSDRIIASSYKDKTYLKYLYDASAEKISVVSPGFDVQLFSPIPKSKAKMEIGSDSLKKLILSVGRIEPLKGFDVLLYAIKILLVKNPKLQKHISLWIVGGDTSEPVSLWSGELKHLEKLRRDLGIKASVKFVGHKAQEMLPYYYSAAELVVMPSHYESFGIVALEAMACGTPVIISNVAGASDLVRTVHGGMLTSVNNPVLLATQIEYILSDRLASQKRQQKIKNKIKNYTWEKSAIQLDRVYRSVLK